MCPKCRDKATDTDRCTVCGDRHSNSECEVANPNFDNDRFKKLEEDEEVSNSKFDPNKYNARSE